MNQLPAALPLLPDVCTDHRRSRLTMEISAHGIEVMLRCLYDEHPLHAVIPISAPAPLSAKAVEEAVYANPLLLCDFESVDIILRTPATVIPGGYTPDTALHQGCTAVAGETSVADMNAVNYVDSDTLKFLQRTFTGARIRGHLGAVVDAMMRYRGRSNREMTYVQLLPHATDVIVMTHGGVQHAASYGVTAPQDSIYFVLAAVEATGFDRVEGEMVLCGSAELREQVIHTLRTYVNSVMPMIHPSGYVREASLEVNQV